MKPIKEKSELLWTAYLITAVRSTDGWTEKKYMKTPVMKKAHTDTKTVHTMTFLSGTAEAGPTMMNMKHGGDTKITQT